MLGSIIVTNPIFGVDLAKIIGDAIGPGVLAATLIKKTPGTRTSLSQSAGTNPTSTSYSCRGFVESYSHRELSLGLAKEQDKKVTLLGATISGGTVYPVPGDQVTIEGATYDVVAVARDPAGAVYECRSR